MEKTLFTEEERGALQEAASSIVKVADYFLAQARKKGLTVETSGKGSEGGARTRSIEIKHPDDIRRFSVYFKEMGKGVLVRVWRQAGGREKVDQYGVLPSNPEAGWKRLWDRWLSVLG